MPGRQVRLVYGSSYLDLNGSTYVMQADNGWQSVGGQLGLRVLVTASTMAEMERKISLLRQVLTRATIYQERMVGDPVYVWTKTCDELETTAELGATWRQKQVLAGRVEVQHISGLAAAPNAFLTLLLEVDDLWQRVLPESVLEATTGAASVLSTTEGGVTANNAAVALYARRLRWTSSTGITVRAFVTLADVNTTINLLRLSANFLASINPDSGACVLADDTGTVASANATFVAGATYEIVVRMAGSDSGIWVNGTRITTYKSALSWPTDPDTYRVWETAASCGVQTLLSYQLWPTALTAVQIVALYGWGRPEGELAWCEPPADTKATNGIYDLHNAPGSAQAALRLIFDGDSQDFARVGSALRMYRQPAALRFECESGSLGANTAANANAAASGGSQARFTPAATGWTTEVTVTLAANPANVAALQGEYRLYLAGYDSAAAVQINQVRWRLVVGGVAGDWSDAMAMAAVSTRSLVDMGTLSIPPGNWPGETLAATTTAYGSAFVTLEIQCSNTTGSGGGTLDMDAVLLAPAEAEGSVTATLDVSDVHLLMDWVTDPPAMILIQDERSLEFGGWGSYAGDDLLLPPSAGSAAGALMVWWYRSSTEEFFPNDVCDVLIFYSPRWLS